ncbi:unnamed protein product, partial [Laminaria digitata]
AGKRRGVDRRTDLDRPLALTGAMEMLATALVSLPAGDVAGAMQCVGALCLVRVLQVLSAYRYSLGEEPSDDGVEVEVRAAEGGKEFARVRRDVGHG